MAYHGFTVLFCESCLFYISRRMRPVDLILDLAMTGPVQGAHKLLSISIVFYRNMPALDRENRVNQR